MVAGATTFPPAGGLYSSLCVSFILPPLAGEVRRSEPIRRMLIMSYDIESKSRNVLASPLGEEGHEVAKGCTRVRMIMILEVDVTAERRHYNTHRPLKGKRLTTFCASLRSGGRRLAVRKMIECHIPAQTRTPFPASRDFPSRGNERYERKTGESYTSMYHSAVSPFGGASHQRGESHRRWLITVMLFMSYDTEKLIT